MLWPSADGTQGNQFSLRWKDSDATHQWHFDPPMPILVDPDVEAVLRLWQLAKLVQPNSGAPGFGIVESVIAYMGRSGVAPLFC